MKINKKYTVISILVLVFLALIARRVITGRY